MQNNDTVFGLAQQSLLAPYALETRHLEQMFSKMLANKVDYADLYFQYSRAESWSLEEGIVKSGSFGKCSIGHTRDCTAGWDANRAAVTCQQQQTFLSATRPHRQFESRGQGCDAGTPVALCACPGSACYSGNSWIGR